jgi:diguanylate cyclase (GGDEF)-like protein/PAS domain S-box-containing protein
MATLSRTAVPGWFAARIGRDWAGFATVRVAPFAILTIVAAVLALPVRWPEPSWVIGGLLLMVLVTLGTWFTPWHRLRPRLEIIPATAMMLAIVTLLQSTGGPTSGFTPLLLIPLGWLAFTGTPGQLRLGFGFLVLVLVVRVAFPIMFLDESAIPPQDLRRGVTLIVVAGCTSWMAQRLVALARLATARAEAQATEMADQAAFTSAILATADDMILTFDQRGTIVKANAAVTTYLGWSPSALIGSRFDKRILATGECERMRSALDTLLRDDSAEPDTRLETQYATADGRSVPVEVSIALTGTRETHVFHAFARDISTRRMAEQAASEHLDDLARLLGVVRDLGSPAGVGKGRDAVCEAARALTGAAVSLFFEHRPDRGLLIATGASADDAAPFRVSLDDQTSIAANVLETGSAAFVSDLQADERVDQAAARRMRVRAAYLQPVMREGRSIGVLVAYWRQPLPDISSRNRSLLELFATLVAGAVERADLTDRLESLARTDALTGLANRRGLEETLVAAMAAAERTEQPLSVVMLDLDHFKRFNDEHGHQAGDWLLREVAETWVRDLRPSDTLARFGGEEFVAILPACPVETAQAVADRLRALVPNGETTSAGIATWRTPESMTDLIARADAALYRAKRGGRNRVELASSRARKPAREDRSRRAADAMPQAPAVVEGGRAAIG